MKDFNRILNQHIYINKEKTCIQEWKNTMVEELSAFLFVSIVLVRLVFFWGLLFF